MSKRSSRVMYLESDEDSIKTDTTAEEDYDDNDEFAVEHILAEEMKPDGEMHYLLKWESYPLHMSTWEKATNITSKELLQVWQRDKIAVRNGDKPAFDINVYNLAVENHFREKEEKARRRAAKRQKRGEALYSPVDREPSNSEDEKSKVTSTKASKVKTQPVKRKGVAQPITKVRKKTAVVQEEGVVSSSDSDDFQPAPRSKSTRKAASSSPASKKARTMSNSQAPTAMESPTQASNPTEKPSKQTEVQKSVSNNVTVSRQGENGRNLDAPAPPPASNAARKSVATPPENPAPLRRLSKSNVFAGDWAEEKKGRQRQRVSGETPKDSTDAQFTKLSIQNRYQKYGKNEPAPDPTALSMVDPKTGVVEPPKISPPQNRPTEIHSAYGRRTPPPASRGRSRSPKPASARELPVLASRVPVQPTLDTNIGASTTPAEGPKTAAGIPFKQITCKFWQAGNCQFTDATCPWAHYHTGRTALDPASVPRNSVTCYFWKQQGRCNKPDAECEFAHFDTGVYAGPPGSFKRKSSTPHVPVRTISDAAPAESPLSPSWTPLDASGGAAQSASILAKSAQVTAPEAPVNNLAEALTAKVNPGTELSSIDQPRNISNVSTSDPRLANRSLSAGASSRSPPKDPRNRPTSIEASETTAQLPKMPPSDTFADGSIENDLKMAQRGIRKLDAIRLLKTGPSTGPINEVYIHMPSERMGEVNLLKDYLTKELNCKVYGTSSEFDNWNYFRNMFKKTPCLLIVHPSENFIRKLPGLHTFLKENATLRVFSIGVQYQQCIREQREPAYEAQRLFPHGGITFISDDVFAYYPEKATEIINKFLEETSAKPAGAELSKIGARPGIKDWILRLAQKKYEEHRGEGEYTDDRWVKCYEVLCQLCPFEQEDPDFTNQSVPLETSHLWSLWEDALPSFKGRWESGDEEGATEYMVNLFAGEASSKVWKYRKFQFVYQRPGTEQEHDAKGWMKKYNHIGVMAPDAVLRLMKVRKAA